MREMFGDEQSVLRLLPDVFRRRRGRPAARTRGAAAAAAARRARTGRDVEQEIELGARGRVSRHDAAAVDHSTTATRAPWTCAFRPASATARASASRAKANRAAAAPKPATCICASASRRTRTFERKGRDLYTRVPMPLTTAVLGGEADVQTLGGKSLRLEDSADDAERAGVPAEGPRHAGDRQDRTSTATCTRPSTCSCRAS